MQRTRIPTPHYVMAGPYSQYAYQNPHYMMPIQHHVRHQYYAPQQRHTRRSFSTTQQIGHSVEKMSTQSKLSDEEWNNICAAKCPTHLRKMVTDPNDSQSAYLRAANANQTPLSTNPSEEISKERTQEETKLSSTNSMYYLDISYIVSW